MKNQAIAAGFQDAFQLTWALGMAGIDILDYRKASNGSPRLFLERDPRGCLGLAFKSPEIENKERALVGIRHKGCELVWKLTEAKI